VQCLEQLPHLEVLNLQNNRIRSFDGMVTASPALASPQLGRRLDAHTGHAQIQQLTACHSLNSLFIKRATVDGKTDDVTSKGA
jgi:hypothetical protein